MTEANLKKKNFPFLQTLGHARQNKYTPCRSIYTFIDTFVMNIFLSGGQSEEDGYAEGKTYINITK